MKRIVAFLSLFTSLGTLLCCALPAAFVVLGMGAAFAGLVGAIPQIIWFSEHKVFLFSLGAVLLLSGGLLQWRARNAACPIDPALGEACAITRDWSRVTYFVALGLYLIGFIFAFIAPRFML
jgi:hypothetical protein